MWGARADRSAGGLLIALGLVLGLALTGCGADLAPQRVAGRASGTTSPYAAPAPTGPPTEPSSGPSTEPPSTLASIPSLSPPSTPVLPSTPVATPKATKAVPVVVTKNVVVIRSVAFGKKNVRDPDRPQGDKAVTTRGVKGKKELTYAVTYTDGRETGRRLLREAITVRPVTQVTSIGTKKESSGGCDPNYTGCVPIASDVDCEGGSGNGPAYVAGPVEVIGSDIYRLDADHDGIGCEDG
ncbi:G5 domain-containing protein [Kribbella sp. NPDC051620]|uniref:G5 domain-containing protein n=1 Tax=Kribbella sp. NPDC051620 TaxID=3364120 RepID=UPI0037B15823